MSQRPAEVVTSSAQPSVSGRVDPYEQVAVPRTIEVEESKSPDSRRGGRLLLLVTLELVEPVVVLVLLQLLGLLVVQAEVGVLRLVTQQVLVLVRLDPGLDQELAAGPAVHVAGPAWLHEPLDRAVGLPARPQAEVDLARREQEADRVAGLHRQVKINHFVHLGARRYDRQRCEADDRHTDVVLVDGPQHRDPRLLGSGDPLRVHACGDEYAWFAHHNVGAMQRKLPEADALPGGTGVDLAGERFRRSARIDRPEQRRCTRPLGPQGQCEQERRDECESGAPDRHHRSFGGTANVVRSGVS